MSQSAQEVCTASLDRQSAQEVCTASLHRQSCRNYETICVTVRVGEDFCTQVALLRIRDTLNTFDTTLKFRAVAMFVISKTKGIISTKL